MNSARPDLIIFGCDGVLVDSETLLADAAAKVLAAAGLELAPHKISERFAGTPFKSMLLALEQETGRPLQASLIGKAEEYMLDRLQRVRTTDGAARIAAAIPRRAVASNASRVRLKLMLEASGLAPLFPQGSFSFEETVTQREKPAPDVFLLAAERLGAQPERCFVIEDTANGVKAALAAGMRPIGYTGASHSFPGHADLLTEAGAETVISRWNALVPVLAALTEWRDV